MSNFKKHFRVFAGRDEKTLFSFGMIVLLQLLMTLLISLKVNGAITNYYLFHGISLVLGVACGLRVSNLLHRKRG